MDHLDTAWVLQYYILREHGVTVAGPAPRTLIDLINPREMRRAAARMRAWWGTMLDDPVPLHRTELGYQAYAVLAMCRMLYTLDTGGVVSKSVAAHWAQWTLGERWIGLIDRALAKRPYTRSKWPGDAGCGYGYG